MKTTVLSIVLAATAATAEVIVRPDIRIANGERRAGITLDLAAALRARRPTKAVYIEEAVALWRPAAGDQIAATGSGQADITAAVDAREEEVELTVTEAAAAHFRRNAGKYVASALAAAIAGGAYAIYDNNKSDSAKPAPAPTPTTNNPQNSPTYVINTGDNSPVHITAPQTAMPPE